MPNQNIPAKTDSVARSAGAMGSATFLSRILGLGRELVFAYLFGASVATDAFNVAFRIPNLLRDLFAEGSMSAALVPTFTKVRVQEGESRAWQAASRVFVILAVLSTLLTLLGIYFAAELVHLYASAFKEIPGKFEQTVELTRVMFPFFPLIAMAAAFMGILNACGKFFVPAFAPALFNLSSISVGLVLVYFSHDLGMHPIVGMAIGVVVGGGVQAICQIPTLFKVGFKFQPWQSGSFAWRKDPALRQMLWLMVPGTIGLGATQINILVNTILATSQGTGAISWLNYAFRLMQFPIGIFGVSLASATLPKISNYIARNDHQGFSDTLTKSLQMAIGINLLASAGLICLGRPIIEMLFQYGRFTAEDTINTAGVLAAYSIGLVSYSTVKLLVPACYALQNTKVPVVSSILSVVMTIVLNLLMIKPFGYIGLAIGTSAAAIFNSLFLFIALHVLLKKQNTRLPVWPVLKTMIAYLFISLIAGASAYYAYLYLQEILPGASILLRMLRLVMTIVGFGIVTLVLGKLFGLTEFVEAFNIVKRRLKR